MRDMLDERRYKRAQLERLRLQTEQEQRELADEQAFRAALPGLGPDATLPEMARIGGKYGIDYYTKQQAAKTAQRLAEKGTVDLDDARRKQAAEIAKQQAWEIHAWTQLPDGQKPQGWTRLNAGWAAKKWPTDPTPPEDWELPGLFEVGGIAKDLADREKARKDLAFGEAEERRKAWEFANKQQLWPTQKQEAEDKALSERLKGTATLLAQVMRTHGLDGYNKFVAEIPDKKVRERFERLMSEKEVLNVGRDPQQIAQAYAAAMPNTWEEWKAVANDASLPQATRAHAEKMAADIQAHQIAIRPPAAVIDYGDPKEWARRVATGEVTIANVPERVRGQTVNELGNAQIVNAKQRQQISGFDKVSGIIDQIEQKSLAVNKKHGLSALLGGAYGSAMAKLQSDPDVQALQRQVGVLGTVARELGGNVGALSDQDIARAIQLIPGIYDDATVAASKIKDLRNLLANARKAVLAQTGTVYQQGGGTGGNVKDASTDDLLRQLLEKRKRK